MPQHDFFGGLLLIAFAIGIGTWSERKGGSFVAGFFASILLTPIVAALILAWRHPLKKSAVSNSGRKTIRRIEQGG
jgi:hypothetical protein